jgi:hypothetical protein
MQERKNIQGMEFLEKLIVEVNIKFLLICLKKITLQFAKLYNFNDFEYSNLLFNLLISILILFYDVDLLKFKTALKNIYASTFNSNKNQIQNSQSCSTYI